MTTPTHRAHAAYATTAPSGPTDGELIQRHAGLIDRLARRIANRAGNPSLQDDLWSVGALGLIDAARRFEASQGVKFETFVEHRVRGAMLDELRRHDHLPRRLRRETDTVLKGRRALSQELGRAATDEEVAARLGISQEELTALEGVAQPPAPLDPELLGLADLPDAGDQLDLSRQVKALAEHIKTLPERLQMVLSLHYTEGCTYREIAQLLKLSEPRVCQLHAQAIERLRELLTRNEAA